MEESEILSCDVEALERVVCNPDKTAVLFIGEDIEKVKPQVDALGELAEAMDIGVIDPSCDTLFQNYSIEKSQSTLIIFQKCQELDRIKLSDKTPEERELPTLRMGLPASTTDLTDWAG